ncbi:hypothetical protein [Tenggerimyces flavus]|uniref:Uncharacterized protein n=1 Tax=Tenggerimyces flavus TaxID=1708749 RepID=A0ABV7YJW2_9ACTN|nr:hypothetical protein [Tenggerimyces flavus]MBM7789551.1 hypothetical protein [Tenggerimyces flavus]
MTRFKNALLEELETMVANQPAPYRRPNWVPRVAAVAGAAALLTVGAVAGAPFGKVAAPKAWAVTDEGNGVIKVKLYEEINADLEGLEKRLEEHGVHAYLVAEPPGKRCEGLDYTASTSPYASELAANAKYEWTESDGALVELTIDRDRLAGDETLVIRHNLGTLPPQAHPDRLAVATTNYVDVAKGPIISPCEFVDFTRHPLPSVVPAR